MNTTQFFNEQELKFIRDEARESETLGEFTDPLLDLIYQKKWLRSTIPLYCDGLEWEVPKIIELFEALAYADGSLGWAVNLGSGANLFSGFLESSVAKSIYDDERICSAGSGAISGTAAESNDGYIIEGYWKYASGSAHATHFTGNAYLTDHKNEPILDDAGEKTFISFIVPREAVDIKQTWDTLGLRASSSDDFEISSCFVPQSHTFSLLMPSPFSPSPLYQFPFIPFSVVSLAVMCSGMAYHFIELFEKNILTKKPLYMEDQLANDSSLMKKFERLTHDFYRSRDKTFQALNDLWDELKSKNNTHEKRENRLIESAREMADLAFRLVSELYRYCGMSIVFMGSELNKTFRDLYVASQHFMISPIHLA